MLIYYLIIYLFRRSFLHLTLVSCVLPLKDPVVPPAGMFIPTSPSLVLSSFRIGIRISYVKAVTTEGGKTEIRVAFCAQEVAADLFLKAFFLDVKDEATRKMDRK